MTARDTAEGGMREMLYVQRRIWVLKLLPDATMLDCVLVNLEKDTPWRIWCMPLACSTWPHSMISTPPPALEDLLAKERRARELGADIAKFAFRLHSPQDMQMGLVLLARAAGPIAVMGIEDPRRRKAASSTPAKAPASSTAILAKHFSGCFHGLNPSFAADAPAGDCSRMAHFG